MHSQYVKTEHLQISLENSVEVVYENILKKLKQEGLQLTFDSKINWPNNPADIFKTMWYVGAANLSKKIVLSGGINVKNVDNAISTQPWCIDINSGVESSIGMKDITLVNKILEKF